MAMALTSRRGALKGALAMVALTAAVLVALPSTQASATAYMWFGGPLHPQQQQASPTWSELRQSQASGYHEWTGAAAHLPGGWTLYGMYITGYGQACHSYAGGNPLGAMLKNDSGLYDSYFTGYANTEVPC